MLTFSFSTETYVRTENEIRVIKYLDSFTSPRIAVITLLIKTEYSGSILKELLKN